MAFHKHGHTTHTGSSPTYKSWHSMLQRCNNPNYTQFKDYGGRGITVCARWHKFENFLEDMGVRPEGMTLDRKDGNLGYDVHNCRWATKKEQQSNTRRNRIWEYQGVRQNVSQWAAQLGMRPHSLHMRVATYGWTIEQALSTPPMLRGRRAKGVEQNQ